MTGELDWYVSSFDLISKSIINNTIGMNCIITFSGTDEYYAVWEENEIATISENGVDMTMCCAVGTTNVTE